MPPVRSNRVELPYARLPLPKTIWALLVALVGVLLIIFVDGAARRIGFLLGVGGAVMQIYFATRPKTQAWGTVQMARAIIFKDPKKAAGRSSTSP